MMKSEQERKQSIMTEQPAPVCYVVTGAAGHLGSTILRFLADGPETVHALIRTGEHPAATAANIRYFEGDVCRPETLEPLFAGTDSRPVIVIHTAAVISIAARMPAHLREVNVGGTENMLQIARTHHVKRFVHVSSVHAVPVLPKGQTMREPSFYAADLVDGAYAKTKAEAAQKVLQAADQGLDAVIVLPSGILGPYDCGHNHLSQMVIEYARGNLPACVGGGYDFVDVRDAAKGCLLAAEHGIRGNSYLLSGHFISICDLLQMTGACCGRKPVPVIPTLLAKLAVPGIGLACRMQKKRPLYTAYSLHTLAVNSCFSHDKADLELGYQVRPLQETVRDMVHWLQAESLI